MSLFFVLLLMVIAIVGILFYNKLKTLAEAVRSKRANILAVTRKRADLAARLVDIANGYGSHEKVAQLQVSEDLTSMAGLMSANASADRVIGQVSSIAAAFPDLKANQTFQQLMVQLEKIETEVLQRRENYNHVVEQYNSYRVRLPQALVANACNFDEAPYFETGTSGLETLADFKTGDTKAVEDLFRRAGERAKSLASTTHAQWKESRLSASAGQGHLEEPDSKNMPNGAP